MKPVEQPQSLLDFDLGEGESSDDSDFRIEDHPEESDDYSINSDDDEKSIALVWNLIDCRLLVSLWNIYISINYLLEANANSGSSDEQSESDAEDVYKNATGKLGEEMSVADLLEKAKQQEFKVILWNKAFCINLAFNYQH